MRNHWIRLTVIVCALLCPALAYAQEGNFATILLSGGGIPLPGVKVAVCSTGLTTTAASVTNNIATLTVTSNPITAGFLATKILTVSGFTGGDTYFNGTFTVLATSASTISYALTHANAAAGTNGKAFQTGDATTSCAPLSSLFTDDTGTVASANPTTSDSGGNVSIWALPGSYNVQYYGSTITLKVVEMSIGIPGALPATITNLTMPDLNGGKYVDGTKYATANAALASCPAAGCTIDMRGNASALALGSFDPGNNGPAVTLLLGPFFYTATQITVREGFRIIGVGRGAVANKGTAIQAQSTTLPLFVGPGSTEKPAIDAWFQSIDLLGPGFTTCSAGVQANATDAFFFDASVSTTGQSGLWYSTFSDVQICGFSTGFHFKGPSTAGANGANQFNNFNNVTVFRANGGVNALRIEGANYQFTFNNNCEFDSYLGNTAIDANVNPLIFIGGGPGSNTAGYPYIVKFIGVTAQGSATAVQIDGGKQITFDHGHHEQANGAYSVTFGANGANINTDNLIISETSFNGNVGKNAGNGFLLKVNTANASGVVFRHNYYNATGAACPDNAVWNTPTGAKTSGTDNEFDCIGNTPATQGMTLSMAAAATVNVGTAHTVNLTTGPAVTTINGGMLPGEYVTFQEANDGSFSTGGNIDLGGPATISVLAGHTATFVRTDIASHTWQLVSTDNIPSTTFANLGTPSNLRAIFCSDCTIANPCAGGGTGALAKRLNGVWVCN